MLNSNARRAAWVAMISLPILLTICTAEAAAQVATTTVQGTVYRADGSAAQGTLIVSWPTFATAANQAVAAGSVTTTIGADGFVSLNLAPNQGAYPDGTYYTAIYHLNDGTVTKEYWVVPAAASAAIASIRAALAPATVAVQAVSKSYVDSSISAITGNYLPLTGGTMSGSLLLNGDPVSGSQAATKHYTDTLAATELPLAGGTMGGTLNTPNAVSKLPRVDVRHPDFGAGCPNTADPKGLSDSTCAIQAAVAFAQAALTNGQYPTVYFPEGTYKISAPLRLPCALHYAGDGPGATTIRQTNNAENAITVINAPAGLDGFLCAGSIENMQITAAGSHLHSANLIEVDSAPGFKLNRVRLYNSGGRGVQLNGSSERMESNDLQIDAVRWPLILTTNTNENHFFKTSINSPGGTADGYCWGNNCPGGIFPGYNWTAAQSLVTASGNGAQLSIVVQGGTDSGSTNGISPLAVGHWFQLSGISNIAAMNGFWQVASVISNSPSAGQYTLAANSTVSGSAVISGASFKPAILPENHSAIWLSGADVGFYGGSIKALYYEGAVQAFNSEAAQIANFYMEGYPVNGQPHMNADITLGGVMPQTSLAATLAAGSLTAAASGLWFPDYYNDPADAQAASCISFVMIAPQDFQWGNSSSSAYVTGVLRDQYEIACVKGFAGDGNLYFASRGQTSVGNYSSNVPAGTTWPAGSLVELITSTIAYGNGLLVTSSHMTGINPPGANWAADCNDATTLTCSEIIAGLVPDGVGIPVPATGGPGIAGAAITLLNDSIFTGSTEPYGQGYLKVHNSANVTVLGSGSMATTSGETYEVANGQYLLGTVCLWSQPFFTLTGTPPRSRTPIRRRESSLIQASDRSSRAPSTGPRPRLSTWEPTRGAALPWGTSSPTRAAGMTWDPPQLPPTPRTGIA
jgi:hypothetical protein